MYNETRQEGFGDEMKRRILMGTYALSAGYYDAYYKKAQQVCQYLLHLISSQCLPILLCLTPCQCLPLLPCWRFSQCLPISLQHEDCIITGLFLQVRTLVQQALTKALQQYDLLLSPVAPTAAFKIGEKVQDPLAMYKQDLMTVHLNLAGKCYTCKHNGLCCVVLPESGMPEDGINMLLL